MTKKPHNYYDILGVSSKAQDADITRAYHNLAKRFHPDLNPQNRRMAELRLRAINEAYTALKTREKRAAYNRTLRLAANNDNTAPLGTKRGGLLSNIGKIFWPTTHAGKDIKS